MRYDPASIGGYVIGTIVFGVLLRVAWELGGKLWGAF
jgi:hypothetical protein